MSLSQRSLAFFHLPLTFFYLIKFFVPLLKSQFPFAHLKQVGRKLMNPFCVNLETPQTMLPCSETKRSDWLKTVT